MGDIDFANPDSRMTYLKDNLGHLMNGIDSNYGQVLMDELMRRMEATVHEFNEEVKAMLGQLQGIKTTPRDNILASAPRTEAQAPRPEPIANILDPVAPRPEPTASAPPTTDLKPAPPVVEPESAPESVELNDDFSEAESFTAPDPSSSVKEVEIEVDLPEDELSDFEKKLRSLSR